MANELSELKELLEGFKREVMLEIEEMKVTINQTHVLVNSRMTKLISTMQQLAEAQEQVESDKAEKRGAANERARARR
jgi:hypothetical protein